MFVAAFHNGLKDGQFNESLAQKPVVTMQEIMKRAKCYIKGKESNAEKRNRDSREKPQDRGSPERYQRRGNQRTNRYQGRNNGRRYQQSWNNGERAYMTDEEYTRLNDTKVHVLDEILSAGLARLPPVPDHHVRLGPNLDECCHYRMCKGYNTEKCYRLKDLIEKLISKIPREGGQG
ncbi:hypothetical protein A2U01_0037089 [Trifolium medium]|uniref:Gag-pol polyprotein n=1 Tax=Trifolium medium TaxID=97028 RepID=A0A392PWR6_9FABA|nr:hypothetical protein [Trifolium medium]